MSGIDLRLLIASGFVSLAVFWLLSTVVWRVTGTWERELTIAERDSGVSVERITLGQLGPLVTGRREVPGGYQELSGFAFGPVPCCRTWPGACWWFHPPAPWPRPWTSTPHWPK